MTSNEAEIRKTLHFWIVFQINPALCALPAKEPPLLGEDFAVSTSKLFEGLSAFRSELIKYLSVIRLDDLQDSFTDRGNPKTPDRRQWCAERRNEFEKRFRSMSTWQRALFAPDRTLAKYDYWAKAAFFSLDEILWLSVGLEPLPEFNSALIVASRRDIERDPVVRHMVAQRELLRRGLDPNHYERRLTAQKVLGWVNLVQHELHSGFRTTLEAMVRRDSAPQVAAPTVVEPPYKQEAVIEVPPEMKRIDPRERQGMAKLLVAIAIEQFGYDPNSKRSPIPTELADVAARLGLELSHDTILKYLRLGAQQLPKDWKPHE